MQPAPRVCTPLLVFGLAVLLLCLHASAGTGAPPEPTAVRVTLGKEAAPTIAVWLETSLKRVFANARPGGAALRVLAPRNGRVAFQACLRNDRIWPLRAD